MASLNQNTAVLGTAYAKHLLRRATFCYSKATIDQFATLTPSQALDLLLQDNALAVTLPYDPLPAGTPDGFWTTSTALSSTFANQGRKANNVAGWWWYNATKSATLKFKLTHFLSTRFTIEKTTNAGTATDFFDHLCLLQKFAYGNYKTLAKKMTVNNSMLLYLNNNANIKTAPNENYAREFFELFTIGKGAQVSAGNYTTYTEVDVVEAAKVLTGFKRQNTRATIDPDTGIPMGIVLFAQHNTTPKTFSAAFGNQTIAPATSGPAMFIELDQFVEMVFGKIATATNICRKMYIYFVKGNITSEVENDIIAPLAQMLFSNGYELAPVIRKLLESQHFYDLDDANANDENVGAIIKSPLQQISEICTSLHATIPDPNTNPAGFYINFWNNFAHNSFMTLSNMILFDPENVAGHPAYYQAPDYDKTWISASTLIARYRLGESMLDGLNRISGNANIVAKIDIVNVVRNVEIFANAADAVALTTQLCNLLFAQNPDAARVTYFMNSFLLQGLATFYWSDAWNLYLANNNKSVVEPRLKLLLSKLLSAPESQIF
ncbi:MAG: hypothetical protein RLZZ312_1897 [Bacteroidota bacterium]|jgi:uncharacterized protein (DUF1800 family)